LKLRKLLIGCLKGHEKATSYWCPSDLDFNQIEFLQYRIMKMLTLFYILSDSHIGFDSRRVTLQRLGMDADKLEDIYGSVPRTLKDFDLKRSQIEIQETLGKAVRLK
jgi:hypothetical protein